MSTIVKSNSNNDNRVEIALMSLYSNKSNPAVTKQLEAIRETAGNFALNLPVQTLAIRIQELYSQKIVGTLYARVLNDDTFSLDLLCVEETSRKRKIGSKLLELAEEYAYSSKAKKIILCTYDFQAPEFYEKKGYRRISQIKNALDHHTMIFFEKPLPEYPSPATDIDLKDLKLETFTKGDTNEVKETIGHAVQGILDYNLQVLQAESKTERDFVEFALVVKDPSDQILGVVLGLLVTGSENGALLVESVGFKNGCENNADIHKHVLEGLEKLAIEHKCLNLVPYEPLVQNAFDHMAFSKDTQLTFRRIIPI